MKHLDNHRVKLIDPLLAPSWLTNKLQSTIAATNVTHTRKQIQAIVQQQSQRLLVVVGPCSIHDPKAALEYANRLSAIKAPLEDALCIVMRCYFEKPRTTIGWKGLINDPLLDNSCDINQGLETARKLLIDINELGLGVATEFLDTLIPQYLADLVSWGAIGARTSESQNHRNLVSGLSMPVGIKNSTTGSIQVAVDGVVAAQHPHSFLGITADGLAAIVHTTGNPDTHIILRGSSTLGPNYDAKSVANSKELLQKKNLSPTVMIDLSHANSHKDHTQQQRVLQCVCEQLSQGDQDIIGIMLESFLVAGRQELNDPQQLEYGKSITDSCVDWDETEQLLNGLADTVRKSRSIPNPEGVNP